ncbi:MAG TPA: type II secretion system protein [Terriglobales bacterium]|nr:type II secretion system protein [Terriglobales bacterium]
MAKLGQQRGFSLIELLIVVAVILVIAAIAIPNMLRAHMAANEASAVASIRALGTAETTYANTYPEYGFTCNIGDMGPPAGSGLATSNAAGLIDAGLASGYKAGYTFAFTNCVAGGSSTVNATFQSTATPVSIGQSGVRAFCSDQGGAVRYDAGGSSSTCLGSGSPL